MQYLCSRSDYAPNRSQSGSNYRKPSCMFWASTINSCMFNTPPYPAVATPSTWVVMTYRIPDTYAATYGYDVKSQWENLTYHPGTWSLESSPDGQDGTWTVMDDSRASRRRYGQTWYRGYNTTPVGVHTSDPYVLKTARPGGGFAHRGGRAGRVRRATWTARFVPGGQAISKLTVDAAAAAAH
jgi:hypothetical protein